MMYLLWFDAEKPPPPFIGSRYVYVAKTTQQAERIIQENGLPLIISFGIGSMTFARYLKRNHSLPEEFTYRVHHDSNRERIRKIMDRKCTR